MYHPFILYYCCLCFEEYQSVWLVLGIILWYTTTKCYLPPVTTDSLPPRHHLLDTGSGVHVSDGLFISIYIRWFSGFSETAAPWVTSFQWIIEADDNADERKPPSCNWRTYGSSDHPSILFPKMVAPSRRMNQLLLLLTEQRKYHQRPRAAIQSWTITLEPSHTPTTAWPSYSPTPNQHVHERPPWSRSRTIFFKTTKPTMLIPREIRNPVAP